MTEVQKILKDLKDNNIVSQTIECFQVKNMNNGYYKLWLTNGKYSYVTDDNFLKIKSYICYKEKNEKTPIERFTENLLWAVSEYENDIKQL